MKNYLLLILGLLIGFNVLSQNFTPINFDTELEIKLKEKANKKFKPYFGWEQGGISYGSYIPNGDNLYYIEMQIAYSIYKRFGIGIAPIYVSNYMIKYLNKNQNQTKYNYYFLPVSFILPITHNEYRNYSFNMKHKELHTNTYLKFSYNILSRYSIDKNYEEWEFFTKPTYSISFFWGANYFDWEMGVTKTPTFNNSLLPEYTIFGKIAIGFMGSLVHPLDKKDIEQKVEDKKTEWIAKQSELQKFKREIPPNLIAELSFKDDNRNGILEGNENAIITIKLKNIGEGKAQGLNVFLINEIYDKELTIGGYSLEKLEPNKTVEIEIPIKASINIKTQLHKLKLNVTEYFGYDMDVCFVNIQTFAYQEPKLNFAGLEIIDTGEKTSAIIKDNLLQAGEMVKVLVYVQNTGQNTAKNTSYIVNSTDENIYIDNKNGVIGDIEAGEVKDFYIYISPNKRVTTTKELPIYLNVTETVGLGNLDNYNLPIFLEKKPANVNILNIEQDIESLKKDIVRFEYTSEKFTVNTGEIIDIALNIPDTKKTKPNSVGVIFGIENYTNMVPAPYASNDAKIIEEYFKKTLGLEQVVSYTEAEVSGFIFDDVFNPENGELQKAVLREETDLFVFYSGHGVPDKSGENIYLFPSDGKYERLETQGYNISSLYANLDALGAKSVTIFIDACFSGSSKVTETVIAENITGNKSGVKIKPIITKNPWETNDNFSVFTSSSFDETSLGFDKTQTGLFTYYLCLGMKGEADTNSDKKITLGELNNYVTTNVSDMSKKISGLQTPQFNGNEDLIIIEYK